MSERLTEAELREIEEPGLDGFGPVRRAFAERLVAEVRRLRGLIVAVAFRDGSNGTAPEGDYGCVFCEAHLFEGPHKSGCPWPALEAEASAIREEPNR